tara:strand:- start:22 stop:645 length:624 start_codon:yes stop_codon:yes gene_type:complete
MGGSKPTPPTIIMPAESNPQAFQTIVPQKSYKDLAESIRRTDDEYNRLVGQRYDTVGTPTEMGARARGVEMQEAASYLASLPKNTTDERFKETPRAFPIKSNRRSTFDTVPGSMSGFGSPRSGTGPGPTGGGRTLGQVGPPPGVFPFPTPRTDPAREAATIRYDKAKDAYAEALKKAKTTPRPFAKPIGTPGFAENKDDIYLPKQIN